MAYRATLALCALVALTTRSFGSTDHLARSATTGTIVEVTDDRSSSPVPQDAVRLYNAACHRATHGDLEQAERLLMDAIRSGFHRFSHMRRDPDLATLRERPVFRAILRARAVADPILARRRAEEWLARMDREDFRLIEDESLRVLFVTDRDEAAVDEFRADLTLVERAARDLLFGDVSRQWVTIVLAAHEELGKWLPHRAARGRYMRESDVILVSETGRALRHEFFHALHHAHMDELGQDHALWIQEGLACIFEAIDGEPGEIARFLPTERDHLAAQCAASSQGSLVERIVGGSDSAFVTAREQSYAVSSSLLRFLADRAELSEWYRMHTARFESDPTGSQSLQSVFARSLREMEIDWRTWAGDASRHSVLSVFAIPPARSSTVEAVAVPPPLPSWPGPRGQRATIERLEEVVAAWPNHETARYRLGLARVAVGDLEGARVQEIALREMNPSLASLLGNLLLR